MLAYPQPVTFGAASPQRCASSYLPPPRFPRLPLTRSLIHIRPISAFVLAVLFTSAANAADCPEVLLGDYSDTADGPAVVRVERVNGRVQARQKDANGQWGTAVFDSPVVPPHEVRRLIGPIDRSVPVCGLGVQGGVLLKLPVGHEYAVSSATEKSTVPQKAVSGYLAYQASGFAVSATDLFPVVRHGASPLPPPIPSKATVGMEVPALPVCAGQRLPDMSQAAFDALPSTEKNGFHRMEAPAQTRFVCGQHLHDLMSQATFLSPALGASRGDTLYRISTLLAAGQIPRNAAGEASWITASQGLLAHNRATGKETIPFQNEYYALFIRDVAPRLSDVADSAVNLYPLVYLLKEMILLPAELGTPTLKALGQKGLLRRTAGAAGETIAIQLLQHSTPTIPPETFAFLLAEGGPGAANHSGVMTTLIDNPSAKHIQLMLNAGARPAQHGWLARARANPAAASTVYPLLLNAAAANARSSPEQARQFSDQITMVLGKLLKRCPTDPADWQEIDRLVEQGARMRGVFDNQGFSETNLAVYALRCPDGFQALLQRGLPLDANYPYPDYAGKRQDTPLLMYVTVLLEDYPPLPSTLKAMLTQHNNANVRPACEGCNLLSPLEMAVQAGHVEVVKVLLDFGADPNDPNKDGRPAFIRALVSNNVEMLEVMNAKRKLDVNRMDKKTISMLAWANCLGAKEAAAWLAREGAVSQGEALCKKP